jgi:hypothetical protein
LREGPRAALAVQSVSRGVRSDVDYDSDGTLSGAGYVAFPPGSRFLMLPRGPRRAAWSGLALYEAVEPQQRIALLAGSAAARAGLITVFPSSDRPEVDWDWWESLVQEVVQPLVGPVERAAFRVPGNPRVAALLMDRVGHAVGFAKIVDGPRSRLATAASDRLGGADLSAFRVPAMLMEGQHRGVRYRVLEPLPEGPHLPPPHDPDRLWATVDEFQAALAPVPGPPGTPPHHVPCHADLTPRNLRRASDGAWWLFDWDNIRFGPRLADELRFWAAAFAYRRRVDVVRAAGRILELLRRRGSDSEILEAVEWPDQVRQTYRDIEPELHAAVGMLASR